MAHPTMLINAAALALAVPLLSATTPAAVADDGAKSVDTRATEVLQKFSKHLSSLDAYETTIVQKLAMQSAFGNEDREESFKFAVAKPNRFALTSVSDSEGESVISDGEKLFTFVPIFDAYVEMDAPKDMLSLFEQVQNETIVLGGLPTSLLTPFFGPGGPDGALGNVRSAKYVGTEQINGTAMHRLSLEVVPELNETGKRRLRSEMGDRANMVFFLDAWIDTGDKPRLHQMELDLAKMLKEMMPDMFEAMPQMGEMKYDMTMTFTQWKTGSAVSSDLFAFKAPEDADKVGSFDELMEAMEDMMAGPSGSPNELLGEQAPSFEAQLLSGESMTLDQHKGKDIVILDFWATWCGPCIRAMPDLMAVAENYKGRNVVLYAVNVRERPEDVEAFLKERKWNLSIPLDRDGSVSDKFKVGGIPQTVIVDKDGTVQAVHIGYSPDTKQQLERELETLLRGSKLVSAPNE